MKIVCFSINPVFPDRITGGASKHLMRLVQYLAGQGHQVVLLAAEAVGGQEVFALGERILVKPVLPFHLPFPQPYLIAPGDLARLCELIAEELRSADRFYIHDGELLLPFLYSDVPTVISFRDNFYPESILGSFINQADEIIAVSNFSAAALRASAGRVLPEIANRIHTVLNGIDPEIFFPTDPSPIFHRFGLDPEKHRIILHPHRPEPGKGLLETIQVVEILVRDFGIEGIRVLVPQWLELMNGEAESEFHRLITAELSRRGLTENFIFHDWLSQSDMAAYYSAGEVTLCLGNMVEAFGNVAYESLVCGTPSIAARVGVHRSQLPDELIDKVDYGDARAAAAAAAQILMKRSRVEGERLERIREAFSLSRQLQSYARIISEAKKRKPPISEPLSIDENTRFALAPWCYLSEKGFFQDYHARYYDIPSLKELLSLSSVITPETRAYCGVQLELAVAWYQLGIIIPIRD
ncbi:MAG: glycosyltransferase family 4 protein [Chloroflexi bacterium]|nr:glycosyltransferase family 4 protein [Chloroflexota bacterium]